MIALPAPLPRLFRDEESGRDSADLLAMAGPGATLDRGGVSDLLAFGYLAGCRTLLAGVRRVLLPWDLPPPDPHPLSMANADSRADRLWELLLSAVAGACAGSRAPRAALSGGLDSRAIAAALAEVAPAGRSAGTFGDSDCADLPVAARVAAALGLPHEVSVLDDDAALRSEGRVWRATGGTGGPAAAPGAATDEGWAAHCDLLLSGCAGDVIWGTSQRPGPSPLRRLRSLGVPFVEPAWDAEVPACPAWASAGGSLAWTNLWTRQAGGTWNGVLSRQALTAVVPVLWDDALLAFCLGLGDEDRRDRGLVRRMLGRHAPPVAVDALPLARTGAVHDLDRALRRSPGWRAEMEAWLRDRAAFLRVGLRPRGVERLVRRALAGRRPGRAGSISRVRSLVRWAHVLDGGRG